MTDETEFDHVIGALFRVFSGSGPSREAYRDHLQHLTPEALTAAVTRAVYELEQGERPSVATLHRFAHEWLHGVELEASEAWGLIQRAVEHWDRYDVGRATQAREMLPAHLLAMLEALGGFPALADAQHPIDAQALFCTNYERLKQRATRFGRLGDLAPGVRHAEYFKHSAQRDGRDERREDIRRRLADWSVMRQREERSEDAT